MKCGIISLFMNIVSKFTEIETFSCSRSKMESLKRDLIEFKIIYTVLVKYDVYGDTGIV